MAIIIDTKSPLKRCLRYQTDFYVFVWTLMIGKPYHGMRVMWIMV